MTISVRRWRLVLGIAALVGAGTCGSSPSSPSQTLSLTGTWSGTWTYVTAGVTVTDTATATITQSGGNAAGTLTSGSGVTGQVTLQVASSMTGTITLSFSLLTPCSTPQVAFTGTETSTTLDFTLAPIPPSANCPWPTNNHFVLTKQ